MQTRHYLSNLFNMSGKGLHYWQQAWNEARFREHYENAEYLLKRYARQSFNSYGSEVAKFYFGESRSIFVASINSKCRRSSKDRKSMESVIKDLQEILKGRPIYKDGDLHNILRVFGEKTEQDYTSSFNIIEKPSFFENFIFFEWFCSFLQQCFSGAEHQEKENAFSRKN